MNDDYSNYIIYDKNNKYLDYGYENKPFYYREEDLQWQNAALLVEIDRLHARMADLEAAVESLTRTVRSLVLRDKLEKE